MWKNRRSKDQIYFEILDALIKKSDGVRLGALREKINTTQNLMKGYIAFLTEKELVKVRKLSKRHKIVKITAKGKDLHAAYKKIYELLR